MSDGTLLKIRNLTVAFPSPDGEDKKVVNGIDLDVAKGECRAIVGESGSGKSLTCLSVLGLLPENARTSGAIHFNGADLLTRSEAQLRSVRGKEIGLVYQDPMAALNPLKTIGAQLREPLRIHLGMSRHEADRAAVDLMGRVGIPRPGERLRDYPFEFSGGMRQRIVIAMAVACNPQLILADEPTTALDVSVQAQVLDLLRDLVDELGLGLLLISHDLAVVAGIADQVTVMRCGDVVERGQVDELFAAPQQDYTRTLLASA